MPTYEYLCKNCETRFEAVQKMTEDPLTDCISCGGPVRRVLFPAGIIFKGSGFHVTDYRKPSDKAKEKADCPSAGGDTKSCSGSDSTCSTCPST